MNQVRCLKPAVSVIVPCYKVDKYLKQCLDSIVNQTFENIEIILVNDGSPDNSLQICQAYALKDSRIVVIDQDNSGVSVARNRGIEVARGDYILFVDPDDWLDLAAIEKLYQKAVRLNLDVLLFSSYKTNETGLSIESFRNFGFEIPSAGFFNPNEVTFEVYSSLPVPPWSYLVLRKLIVEHSITFPVGISFEDDIFSRKLFFFSKRVGNLKESLYFYRVRPGSAMMTLDRRLPDLFKIKTMDLDLILEYKPLFYKRFLKINIDYLCRRFFSLSPDKKSEAIQFFHEFLKRHYLENYQKILTMENAWLLKVILEKKKFTISIFDISRFYWNYFRYKIMSDVCKRKNKGHYQSKYNYYKDLLENLGR